MITLAPMVTAATSSFHIDLGDLPTWLGVAAASVAAVFVYLQLRSQQQEFARQVRALERQQADQVAVRMAGRFPSDSDAIETLGSYRREGLVTQDELSLLTVRNGSGRPIQQVRSRIENTEVGFIQIGAKRRTATSNFPLEWPQPPFVMWTESEWSALFQERFVEMLPYDNQEGFAQDSPEAGAFRTRDGSGAQFLRPGSMCGFVFPGIWRGDGRFRVRFTDDAELHWQIDENLHLQKIEAPDW